jgi:hypothetical protein
MTEMLEVIEMIYDKEGHPIDWYTSNESCFCKVSWQKHRGIGK